MPGVQGQPGDGDRSDRRATQSANTNGRHRPPGCLDVARGTHLGQRPGAASQAGHMTAFEPPPVSRPIHLNPAGSSKTITKARRSMVDHHADAGLGRPAFPSVARWLAALKDASRRARARWPREGARPSLTAANQPASEVSGRGRKTALQPNRKTRLQQGSGRIIQGHKTGISRHQRAPSSHVRATYLNHGGRPHMVLHHVRGHDLNPSMIIANAKSRRATFASPSREANARRPAASCSVRVIATVIVSLRRQNRAIESYYVEPDQERI
jgi:hypothetical protein